MSEPVKPPDPDRRRFFRQFAGEVATSVGSMMGAAQTLQVTSTEAARELLGSSRDSSPNAGVPVGGLATLTTAAPSTEPQDASTAGWRAPFRWDGDVCRIVDQRRLPDVLVDIELRGAADAVNAINDGALVGTLVQAQVGAVVLALVAKNGTASRSFARRATIRGAANALRLARPGSAAVGAALDRMLALLELAGHDATGDEVAALFHEEAEQLIGEAIEDHGRLVGHLVGILPGAPTEPLHLLVAGSTGAMGGGQFGTALSAVQAIHHAGRPVHALVTEGRPSFEGSRIAAWELRQAGVPHAVVTDGAAPGCVAAGEVEAVLAGADRVTANGDVIAMAGAYPLALACQASGVPFIVCAPTNVIDLAVADGASATIEEGRPSPVLRAAGTRIAPEGTQVRNPVQDLVPASLVTAIVTDEGVARAPFEGSLAVAAAAASGRRAGARGYAALLAQREAAVPAPEPVDVAALRNPPRTPGS